MGGIWAFGMGGPRARRRVPVMAGETRAGSVPDGRVAGEGQHIGELVVRVFDRGPEPDWHADRRYFGPWWRYGAALADDEAAVEVGMTPAEAVRRLVCAERAGLERRWPSHGAGS